MVAVSLKKLNLEEEVTICSLAKKHEEIFIPGFTKSLDTDENQKGVLLLRRVRDEAHRFALSFHLSLIHISEPTRPY